jgi:polysaccharide pyruvyl transferase WcaK-like protein
VIDAFLNKLNGNLAVDCGERNLCNHDLKIVLELCKECDLIVGMRYHSLVFAKALNVPFIPLSYAWKTAVFVAEGGDGPDPEIALKALRELAGGFLDKQNQISKYTLSIQNS